MAILSAETTPTGLNMLDKKGLPYVIIIGMAALLAYVVEVRPPAHEQEVIALREKVKNLSEQVAALSAENEALKSQSVSSPVQVKSETSSVPIAAHKAGAVAGGPRGSAEERKAFQNWMFDRKLAEMEKDVAINDSEKAQLKDRMAALRESRSATAASGGQPGDLEQQEQEVLRDVLGEDRAASLAKSRAERESRMAQEDLEQATFTFARKLSLSPEQESQAAAALKDIEAEAQPLKDAVETKMKNITAQHGTATPETIRAAFEELQKMQKESKEAKRRMLETKFRGFLSDEQYNRLLEESASADNMYGLNGY